MTVPVALVTGAGARLGRAIAVQLAATGRDVAVHYHNSCSGADETCEMIRRGGRKAVAFQADLRDRTAARALVEQVVVQMGRLDVLVASAASFERIPFDQLDDAAWDRSMHLNAACQFALAHQAAPALRASNGCIVFLTCASTITPFRNHLPYVVSKAATLQLARTLALELAPDVRVNAVAPGTVLPPENYARGVQQRLLQSIPLQAFGGAQAVAQAVCYLADAAFVTGHQLLVDGGRTVAAIERFE